MLLSALRRGGAALACGALVLVTGCNEQRLQGAVAGDRTLPIVSIQKTAGDTLTLTQGVVFSVSAVDNLGLKTISIELAGGLTTRIDSTFRAAVTTVTIPVSIPLPSNSTAGGTILITATAVDGNDNTADTRDSVFLVNQAALTVRVTSPSAGAVASAGRDVAIRVIATQADGVRRVGYLVDGAFTAGDSVSQGTPLPDTLIFNDTLTVPAGATSGSFTITGFAEDGDGRRATSAPVTVTIQSAANDNTPPTVRVTVADRVEVDDSVTVNATDPSGIALIGWIATLIGTTTVVGGDSTTLAGNLTDVTMTYPLGFNFGSLPQTVVITGFAVDGSGNRGTTAGSAAAGSVAAPLPPVRVRRGRDGR
jgi:hypothetical protein